MVRFFWAVPCLKEIIVLFTPLILVQFEGSLKHRLSDHGPAPSIIPAAGRGAELGINKLEGRTYSS